MSIIEIICDEIGADPKGSPEEITEALAAAEPEQLMAALTAVIVAQACAPRTKATR